MLDTEYALVAKPGVMSMKNFTILSLGTVVSTLGNAVSGFAISISSVT